MGVEDGYLGHLGHLVRRFVGALSSAPPSADDEAWVRSSLLPGELAVWRRMANADRRHAVIVARRFLAADPSADRPQVAAALLHDCGKVTTDLGTFGRVVATVWIASVGFDRAACGQGRFARYTRHEAIGADLLASAGSDPVTVALVGRRPGAPTRALAALAAADAV